MYSEPPRLQHAVRCEGRVAGSGAGTDKASDQTKPDHGGAVGTAVVWGLAGWWAGGLVVDVVVDAGRLCRWVWAWKGEDVVWWTWWTYVLDARDVVDGFAVAGEKEAHGFNGRAARH